MSFRNGILFCVARLQLKWGWGWTVGGSSKKPWNARWGSVTFRPLVNDCWPGSDLALQENDICPLKMNVLCQCGGCIRKAETVRTWTETMGIKLLSYLEREPPGLDVRVENGCWRIWFALLSRGEWQEMNLFRIRSRSLAGKVDNELGFRQTEK